MRFLTQLFCLSWLNVVCESLKEHTRKCTLCFFIKTDNNKNRYPIVRIYLGKLCMWHTIIEIHIIRWKTIIAKFTCIHIITTLYFIYYNMTVEFWHNGFSILWPSFPFKTPIWIYLTATPFFTRSAHYAYEYNIFREILITCIYGI